MLAPWRNEGSAELFIDTSPVAVYNRISDVTATSHTSLDCTSCEWLPGMPAGEPGSRFRGRNRSDSTPWGYRLEPRGRAPR